MGDLVRQPPSHVELDSADNIAAWFKLREFVLLCRDRQVRSMSANIAFIVLQELFWLGLVVLLVVIDAQIWPHLTETATVYGFVVFTSVGFVLYNGLVLWMMSSGFSVNRRQLEHANVCEDEHWRMYFRTRHAKTYRSTGRD